MNLLSNALKFTLSGYVLLMVSLKRDVLQVTVKDSGVGIPESFLPHLFEPFKQVQARGAEHGTGLGMSITKQLLQRMQGNITVDSKYQQDQDVGLVNCGSTFTITIPIPLDEVENSSDNPSLKFVKPLQIAIMHDAKHRGLEGFTTAWRSFGAEVTHAQQITDVLGHPDYIIWGDLSFLQKHSSIRQTLLSQEQHLVLVPYENKTLLDETLGSPLPMNIVPICKPLIWHRILRSIISARQLEHTPQQNTSIKLAPKFNPIETLANEGTIRAPAARKRTILLVEDNKVRR